MLSLTSTPRHVTLKTLHNSSHRADTQVTMLCLGQSDKFTSALASRTTDTPLSSSWQTITFLSDFPLRSRAPFQRDSSYLYKYTHASTHIHRTILTANFTCFKPMFCTGRGYSGGQELATLPSVGTNS